MKKTALIFIIFSSFLYGQQNYTISGLVKDKDNGETLYGVSVFLKGTTIGVITNEYGFYSISAPENTYNITISYMGYEEVNQEVLLNQDQKIDFDLSEATNELDEVVITSEETEQVNIRTPQMSVSKVNIQTIKKMPVVLGEVDIIKSIQMLPGVTNNGEGSSGFNVRGGSVDQNLVLLDEAIIYNTSHLLGFFSVFNADAIKDIKLYKGAIPANFGGRSSSVLDVRQKDGNSNRFSLTGGIGLISSRLAAEGPMLKNKGAFLIAGRGSYAHLFLKLSDTDNSANFYDMNLKTNYEINKNNKLYLSGYFGRDGLDISNSFTIKYGNVSGNLRWNHIFNDKLFSNLSMVYSKYDYGLELKFLSFDWVSSINNYNLKYDFNYYLSNNIKLDFGASGIYYNFNPGAVNPTSSESSFNSIQLDLKKAFEAGVYLNIKHKIADRFTAQYGLRLSSFSRLGGQVMLQYANNQPVVYDPVLDIYEAGTPVGETNYTSGETIKNYTNLEPRLGLAYELNETSSVKAGFSRTAQYIHLLSNTTNVSPLDVWTPSGEFIKPQLSNQYALGYFKNFNQDTYSLEVETYYKTVDDVIDYIDGADLIGNNYIEQEILIGESRAYGLELLLRKNRGKLKGWVAYTISNAERRTLGGNAGGPGINEGNWYKSPYDRTHDLSITASYQLNEKWNLSSNFAFQSGRPVTYPNGQYSYEGIAIANYEDRNSSRLPVYHRLDIAATYVPNRKPENKWKGEWVFGIYNAYNRKNAAAISFNQNRTTGVNEATRTAVFGIVPSVTYNFKF